MTERSLTIRAAKVADKDQVLAFCQHTFDWGDYLPEVWDRWLNEQGSHLMVGDIDGTPVAVGNVRLVSTDEAWLQGLRIDPSYRGTGLAHAFTVNATRFASELGARVVRLTTLPTTIAIHKVMDGLGYRRVGDFVSYQANAVDLAPEPFDVLGPSDLDRVLRFLDRSPAFAAMGRLHCADWVCYGMTGTTLLPRIERGDVWARRVASRLAAVVVVGRDGRESFEVEFADGEQSELVVLAAVTRNRAFAAGRSSVQARLAKVAGVLTAFEQAGFTCEGHEFWIFEKKLVQD